MDTSEDRLGRLEQKVDEIEQLVKDIHGRSGEWHRYIIWQRVWGALKILIFVIPFILAIVYLPPLIQNALAPYWELLNTQTNTNSGSTSDLNSLLQQLQQNK